LIEIKSKWHLTKKNGGATRMKKHITKRIGTTLSATLCAGTVLASDGTGEPGFVPPPREPKLPPAPPRTVSSAETLLACCCCPVTPMARTEAKKPPQPPVLVTKIRDERVPE
jgi:hypothetical protein